MKKFLSRYVFFSLLAITNVSFAFAPNCPLEIHTSQKLLGSFQNWRELHLVTSHYLSQIELYDGSPEELAVLKPDSQSDEKAVWHFRQGSTNYIVCRYNETRVRLTTSLPKKISRCTILYSKNARNSFGAPIPDRILCQ